MKLMTIFIVILIVGGYFVVKVNSLDLNDAEDRETFLGKFWIWMKGFGKSSADVAGYAATKDWLPQNNTNKTRT